MDANAKKNDVVASSDQHVALSLWADRKMAINEDERDRGLSTFFQSDDDERLTLVEAVVDDHDNEMFGYEKAAGILRAAWDSEPYVRGCRETNYITACGLQHSHVSEHLEFLLEHFGQAMMMPHEREKLASFKFPLTVFRGGAGHTGVLRMGVSWTLRRETADFFADYWSTRFLNPEPPVVLSRIVERDDVLAYFNARAENEIILVDDNAPPNVVS